MLTFLICLLHVMASVFAPTSENYILHIDHNTLKNVGFIGDPSPVLNLSSKNLQALEKNVFHNLINLESLDLSNNSLISLPEFIFSSLTKLKSLSLANNRMQKLQYLFLGLNNLQLLDISRNPIKHLIKGSLFGLPKSARILTDENNFWRFSTDMSNFSFTYEDLMSIILRTDTVYETKAEIEKIGDTESQNAEIYRALDNHTQLKLCKSDGIVTMLDILWINEDLVEGCVLINVPARQIDFYDQNITGFREGWYRVYYLPVKSLDLSINKIADIEKETLNNLPEGLTHVNFQNNQIRKIRSHVIENRHLRQLNFKNNSVEVIEDNAFAKTRVRVLNLCGNQLKSLNFVSTLPNTIAKFIASKNHITYVPNKAFSRLSNLSYLNLRENKIETLQNDVFQNLTSLRTLILATNNITTIEPAAFNGHSALKMLDLQRNLIRVLQASTFAELTTLKTLDLSWNKIDKVPFIDLPRTLNDLYLDFNEISVLEKDSFVKAPRMILSLVGNYISRIARGAFNLPNLRNLYLNKNSLTTIEGDSYKGLGRLTRLWLSQNQISEIRKGACKNFENLYLLDISSNPFQKLEAGALYGLSNNGGISLDVYDNNLKEMQVGLFDDI